MKKPSKIQQLNNPKNLSKISKVALTFSKRIIAVTGIFLLSASAIALPAPSASANFSLFSSPSDKQSRGRVPGRRRGGARRGTCPNTQTQLVALVSAVEVETETLPETYVGGVTAAERPAFWFDIPYALSSELTAEFVLQDSQGQNIYRTTSADFATSHQTPGIIGIGLPSDIAPLEIGQTYQWYFKINCGSETPLYVQGGIERIALDPSLASQIESTAPLNLAALYQENDIPYDAVNAIAPLYLAQPNDPTIVATWTNLLRSLNL